MQATMKDMEEFHKQLKKGSIQRAYKTLLSYTDEASDIFQK